MTRTEAIALIEATLPKLADAHVADLAELVRTASEPATPFRDLTPEEAAGVAQAAADFKSGRVLTSEQYRAEMASFLTRMQAKYPTAP